MYEATNFSLLFNFYLWSTLKQKKFIQQKQFHNGERV